MSIEELYQELLLEHFKDPRCRGTLDAPDATVKTFNPLCGDTLDLGILLEGDKVKEIAHTGKGCAISQATASLMSEHCEGMTMDEIEKLSLVFKDMLQSAEFDESALDDLGDMQSLYGIRKFPARYKCAFLAWEAILQCFKEVKSK